MKLILILFVVCFSFMTILCHGSHGMKKGHDHQKMHDSKMSQDIEHVMEHLKNKIDLEREISTEELEFYYFFEHDFNNDSRLDGLEILAAIKHSELGHEMETITANLTGHALKEAHSNELRDYTDLIDDILKEDDKNNDGYISYIEYVFARRRENEEVKREYNKEKGTR